MHKPPPTLSQHRFARIIRWAQTMLTWVAYALFAHAALTSRHLRQRYAFLSLDWLAHLVCKLAIVRAAKLVRPSRRAPRPTYDAARPGFRRRIARGAIVRALAGSRLRKALKHRDPCTRIQLLLAVLANIDAFARRYLTRRMRRRLTKLRAITIAQPQRDACASILAPAPCAANTS